MDKQATIGRRVYTYHDDDGNVYWSFYKQVQLVSPPTRLTLQGRIGTHTIVFLSNLRRQAQALWEGLLQG